MSYDKNSLNKVQLIGRLGADPEVKYTPSGAAVCTLSLATTTAYKEKDGKAHETTEWHRVVLWRQQAEAVGKYCHKGSRLYVEGKLATRSWDDKDGVKHYTTEVAADQVQFLDSKPKSDADDDDGHDPFERPAEREAARSNGHDEKPAAAEDSDLPF